MALPNVYMKDTDGNIPSASASSRIERVSGLIFDISGQNNFWTTGSGASIASTFKDKIVELNSLDDAVKAGITKYTGTDDVLAGIPYHHISDFFAISGASDSRLFVMFTDCSKGWDAIYEMQRAANGDIFQIGIWTEQQLWSSSDAESETYEVNLVKDIEAVAEQVADEYFTPVHIMLCANTSKVKIGNEVSNTIALSKIPSCVTDARYVTVLLSQAATNDVQKMQASLDSTTPVGVVGVSIGVLAVANVGESIGNVGKYDIVSRVPLIEMGFGDSSVANDKITNAFGYSSLTKSQLDTLEDKGYVFVMSISGYTGHTYFTSDNTCSNGDFCLISRNRAINKSRRLVRMALLPYVNAPIKVDPANGNLPSSFITEVTNKVSSILSSMASNNEISGASFINMPAEQNILVTKKLTLSYGIVPMGCAEEIRVTEGLYVSQP